MIRYTYQYVYELAIIPALMHDRLEGFATEVEKNEKKAERLKDINVYRRLYLWMINIPVKRILKEIVDTLMNAP